MIQAALGLNISGFVTGATQATSAMGRLAGAAGKAAGGVTGPWQAIASATYIANQAIGVFTGIIGGAARAMGSLGQAMVNSAKAVRDLQSMSEESGLAIDKLVVLRGAFVRVGISADEASQSITQMSKRLAQGAMFGTGEGVRAFSLLGINMRKMAETGDVLDNFQQIIKALKGVQNDALRTALATEIFGKSGAKMLRIDTSKLAEAEKIFKNQGRILKESAGFLSFFASVVDGVKEQIIGFWAAFTSRVVPPWLGWIQKLETLDLTSWGQTIGNFVANVFGNLSANKGTIYKFFIDLSAGLVNSVVNLASAAISGLITMLTDFSFWSALASGLVSVVMNAVSAVVLLLKETLQKIGSFIGPILMVIGAVLSPPLIAFGMAVYLLSKVVGIFFDAVVWLIDGVASLTKGLFGWLTDFFSGVDDRKSKNLGDKSSGERAAGDLSDSAEGLKNMVQDVGKNNAATDSVLKSFQTPEQGGSQALPAVAKTAQFVSSMAKVGGGGGFAGGAFNLGAVQLNETRVQTNIQRDQLKVLQDIRGNIKQSYQESDYSGQGADFILP